MRQGRSASETTCPISALVSRHVRRVMKLARLRVGGVTINAKLRRTQVVVLAMGALL